MGRSLALLGEFDAGIAMTQEGVPRSPMRPSTRTALSWPTGEWETRTWCAGSCRLPSAPSSERSTLCRSGGFALMASILARFLGEAYALAGRSGEALELLDSAVSQLAAMKYAPALPSAHAGLGEAYLLAGRLDEARHAVSRALDLCRAHRQFGNEALALRALGAIEGAQDPPAATAALTAYTGALALSEERGMRPLAARCRPGPRPAPSEMRRMSASPGRISRWRGPHSGELRMDLRHAQADEELAGLGPAGT